MDFLVEFVCGFFLYFDRFLRIVLKSLMIVVYIDCLRFFVDLLMGRKLYLIILDEGKYYMRSYKVVLFYSWDGISFFFVVVFLEIELYYYDLYYFKIIFNDLW